MLHFAVSVYKESHFSRADTPTQNLTNVIKWVFIYILVASSSWVGNNSVTIDLEDCF